MFCDVYFVILLCYLFSLTVGNFVLYPCIPVLRALYECDIIICSLFSQKKKNNI